MEPPPTADEPLYHPIPRLDAPDKLWILPAPVAKWLGGAFVSGPAVAQALVLAGNVHPWDDPRLWVAWALALLVGACGAFVRPGGLDLARWLGVLVDYALLPKRAVWKPVGRGILWW